MKILMVIDGKSFGGVETQIYSLSKELLLMGYEIILATSNPKIGNKFNDIGVKCYIMPIYIVISKENIINNTKLYLLSIKKLIDIIQDNQIDIIHSHAPSSSAYLSYIVSKMVNKPLIYTIHMNGSIRFFWTFMKYVGYKCDAIIAISEEIKSFLTEKIGIKNEIHVIYNGINLVDYQPYRNNINYNNTQKIVHISRLDKDKVDATLKIVYSITEIKNRIPDIKLSIIGDGDKFESVSETVEIVNNKLKNNVIELKGYIEPEKIPHYLQDADIVIGAGRVAIEAMACKKPVLFLSSKGLAGLLTHESQDRIKYHNFSGRGFKTQYEAQDIAEVVIESLSHPKRIKESIDLSQEILKDLDIKVVSYQTEDIYRKLDNV